MLENEVPEPQFIQVPGESEEMVIVSTKIPRRYYDVIKEMVELDPEDTLEWWLNRAIKTDADCLAESPEFLIDVYRARWLKMLEA